MTWSETQDGLSFRSLAAVLLGLGLVFSLPFAFFPKSGGISSAAFLLVTMVLMRSGLLTPLKRSEVMMHGVAVTATMALFIYHSFDPLYFKFVMALILSFLLTVADTRVLMLVQKWIIYLGSRGAILAICSFIIYFALGMTPFYRTELADGRSIPFFGFTNINFGFGNPELLVFARPAFLFDEPGQFAHFILLVLALIGVSSASVRRKYRLEIVLLAISGIATFSLAFISIAVVYILTQSTRWKTWLLIGALASVAWIFSQNPLLQTLFSRFGSSDGGSEPRLIAGDNRSREVALAYEAFKENPVWGAGWTYADETVGHFAANPLGPLGYSGLMAILMYMPLVARLLRCMRAISDRHQLLVVLLVSVFFAQRPYFYFPIYMFLLEVMYRRLAGHECVESHGPNALYQAVQTCPGTG